jgi:nucleotide-binding universal stress UspA family protein
MYEKILIPLDGSSVGEAALRNVEELVTRISPDIKLEIVLLKVVPYVTFNVLTLDPGAQMPLNSNEYEELEKESLDYLDKIAAPIRERGIQVKSIVKVGSSAEEIIKTAKETGASLIAMSTHGFSGIKRWALGSVTDEVLKTSEVPILVIRAREKPV